MGQQLWKIVDTYGAEWADEDVGSAARREYFINVFERVSGLTVLCVGVAAVLASETWGVIWGITLVADAAALLVVVGLCVVGVVYARRA
jgi:hypothetical protein